MWPCAYNIHNFYINALNHCIRNLEQLELVEKWKGSTATPSCPPAAARHWLVGSWFRRLWRRSSDTKRRSTNDCGALCRCSPQGGKTCKYLQANVSFRNDKVLQNPAKLSFGGYKVCHMQVRIPRWFGRKQGQSYHCELHRTHLCDTWGLVPLHCARQELWWGCWFGDPVLAASPNNAVDSFTDLQGQKIDTAPHPVRSRVAMDCLHCSCGLGYWFGILLHQCPCHVCPSEPPVIQTCWLLPLQWSHHTPESKQTINLASEVC